MAEPNRLFFALWPDDAVRTACAQAARDLKLRVQPGGYLIRPERYHITLLFLGDFVPAEKEAAARQAASLLRAAPFTLALDRAGSFSRNRQIPWWLGTRETPVGLSALYHDLREALVGAGVQPDRMKFVPHLTVIRDAHRALPDTAIKPVSWGVKEFVLIRSLLQRQPVEYELLGRWPLVEGAQAPGKSPAQMNLWEN